MDTDNPPNVIDIAQAASRAHTATEAEQARLDGWYTQLQPGDIGYDELGEALDLIEATLTALEEVLGELKDAIS